MKRCITFLALVLLLSVVIVPTGCNAATLSNTGTAQVIMNVLDIEMVSPGDDEERAEIRGRITLIEFYFREESESLAPKLHIGDELDVKFWRVDGNSGKENKDWAEVEKVRKGDFIRLTLDNKADRDDWWVDESQGIDIIPPSIYYLESVGAIVLVFIVIIIIVYLIVKRVRKKRKNKEEKEERAESKGPGPEVQDK